MLPAKSMLLLLAFSATLLPQELSLPPWSSRVRLIISVDNTNIESLVTSFISRELRSLGDITIADEEADYEISVPGVETAIQNDVKTGTAISVVVYSFVNHTTTMFATMLKAKNVDQAIINMLKYSYHDVRKQELHLILVFPIKNTQTVCKNLVARIDTIIFEPSRKQWQDNLDANKKITK